MTWWCPKCHVNISDHLRRGVLPECRDCKALAPVEFARLEHRLLGFKWPLEHILTRVYVGGWLADADYSEKLAQIWPGMLKRLTKIYGDRSREVAEFVCRISFVRIVKQEVIKPYEPLLALAGAPSAHRVRRLLDRDGDHAVMNRVGRFLLG